MKGVLKAPKLTPTMVKNMYPWFFERGLKFVTHNDLDGIISALILCHYLGWELVGVYDLQGLYLDTNFKGDIRDIIYIDLDITNPNYKSLGHHIIGEQNSNHLNINNLFGINHNRYKEKFPLSTSLFLFWLLEKTLPNPNLKSEILSFLFLLHADSVYKNHKDYTNNVQNWLYQLDFDYLIPYLSDSRIEDKINKHILPNTVGWNNQCTYIVENNKLVFKQSDMDFQTYVDKISNAFGYKRLKYPNELKCQFSLSRKQVEIPNRNFEEVLTSLKKENHIFSHSLKYWNKVDFSFISKK